MWDPVESRPPNVLLVGARPDEVVLLGEAISGLNLGVRFSTVASCSSAIDVLVQEDGGEEWPRPDLIVLFCDRHDPDPIDILPEIRKLPDHEITPIIFFASAHSQWRIQRAYKLGANCVIHKPPTVKEFEQACRDVLGFWLASVELPGQ